MRVSLFIFIIILFSGCSTPKFDYDDSKNTTNIDVEKKFLATLEAENEMYSILFFTDGFLENQNIQIKNGDAIIFDEIPKTDRVLGLANVIRVNNRLDIIVTNIDTDYTFKLPIKKNIKYKYIDISKIVEEDKSYTIKYSNAFRGFY